MLAFPPFTVDPERRQLFRDNQRIEIATRPLEILLFLISRQGQTVSREELRKGIWGVESVTDANIEQNISVLRKVLGDSARTPVYIQTVSGTGYRFVAFTHRLSTEPKLDASPNDPQPSSAKFASVTWFRWLAATTVLVILGTVACFISFKRTPTHWTVSGNALLVQDEHGSQLWAHRFPQDMNTESYGQHPPDCEFVDLNADGRLETIFWYAAPSLPHSLSSLFVFGPNGDVLWTFSVKSSARGSSSRDFTPPWAVSAFTSVPPVAGPPSIVVTSHHNWGYASNVSTLNAHGQVVGEYWHRGHLNRIAKVVMGDDPRPRILVGGVNDAPERRQATLLVLDDRHLSGGSRAPNGTPYFPDSPRASESMEVFFPRTLLNRDQEFNQVNAITVYPNRIIAVVTEGILTAEPGIVVYEFDHAMNILNVTLGDFASGQYRKLEDAGKIPKGTHLHEAERLKREVEVIRRW